MAETLVNNRYLLESELGRGARGVVYRAVDKLLGRIIAVKILSETSIDTASRARLLNEARSAAKLNHPNIVTVYDAGEVDGLPYIVMEYVDGKTLFEQKPTSIEEIISVAKQICLALEHAHSKGIIHRDLKPENLLVTEEGTVKLTDFGLARSKVSSRLTVEGQILGTVYYLSPEQALGREVDGRSDLYSVGVLLYELVADRLPFDGEDPLAIISQHLHASVVPPLSYNNAIPSGLNQLIVKLLSKEIEDRPGSAREVVKALESLESGDPDLSVSPEIPLVQRIARGRIIGREKQLANAISYWQRAAEGVGQVLAITGEPGIGKTRLARELLTLVEVSGGFTCFTECFPEGDAPYAPIAQMIRNVLIQRSGSGNGSGEFSIQVPPLVLADLITIAPDLKFHFPNITLNPALDPAFEQQRLFESVITLLNEITSKKPFFLIIDDIHWADSGTLALLRYIARRIHKQAVLLLLIYREVELDEERYFNEVLVDLNRERLINRIKLTRLNLTQTGEMLEALFQEKVSQSFLEDLFNETEGNPFFIEEVCKALIEEGKVYNENGHWHWTELEQFEIPQSVRLAVQSRVKKLPETAQETLRYAALLGREFEFETLKGISDLDEDSLVDGLEMAVHSQLVDEIHRSGELKFVFAHALIPSSLREGMSYLRRQRLHRRIASYFEKRHPDNYVALAYHYSQGGDEGQARKYYLLAGNRALSVYAGPEAERYFRAALELGGDDEQRANAFYGIGRSLRLQSKPGEALKVWEQAIGFYKSLNDINRVAWIYSLSARTAWEEGSKLRSLHLAREGLSAVDINLETREVAALLHEAARACYFNNIYDEAYDFCNKALTIAEKVGDAEVQAEALTTLGILPGQSLEERHSVLSRAVELAESNGLLHTAARAYNNLAVYIGKLQDIRQAKRYFLKAAEIIKPAGMKNHQLFYLMNAAQMTLEIGEHDEVESMIPTLKELSDSLEESHHWGSSMESLEIRLLRIRGDLDKAVEKLLNLRAKNVKKHDKMGLSDTNASLADILLELGRYEEAEELIKELIELNELKEKIWFGHVLMAILNALQGRVIEARQSYEQATNLVDNDSQGNADIELPFGEAILLASEGNWEKAFALFEDTSQKRGSQKALWGQAYILRVWAEFHLKRNSAGDVERAQDLLNQALEIYTSLNLPIYERKIKHQLEKLL
jgi:predicted ATPase